jgi:hypothetical protein
MAGDKDFERRLEIIERGIAALEHTPDAGTRATALQLVQTILELHGRGLERLLEIVHDATPGGGAAVIDRLGQDPAVGALLLLHSLHPLTLDERVETALEQVRRSLPAGTGHVELLGIVDGAVHLRIAGGPAIKAAVERALIDAAPDAAGLHVQGDVEAVVGFVALDALRGRTAVPAAITAAVPVAASRGA